MTDKGRSLQMLIMTGSKSGNSSLGLDSNTLNFISLPFMREFEGNQASNNDNNDSFERNSDQIHSISENSEIKEDPAAKDDDLKPTTNVFEAHKRIDDEDFEDFVEEKHEVPMKKEPKKRKYSYEAIIDDAGPEQFLKVLSKDSKQRYFKLSDLYYPTTETEYQDLKTQIDEENEKNRFTKLTSVLNLKEKRESLKEFFQTLVPKALQEIHDKKSSPPQISNDNSHNKPANIPNEPKNIVKFITVDYSKPIIPMELPKCFNKINSKEFFQELQISLLREEQQNIFIPEYETGVAESTIKLAEFYDGSFRDLTKSKNHNGFETPALDMGFVDPTSEKKADLLKSNRIYHNGLETPGLDMGFLNEGTDKKPALKTSEHLDSHNDEDELLMEFKGSSLNVEGKLLWGETKGYIEKNEGFFGNDKETPNIFQIKEEFHNENPGFNHFSKKEIMIKNHNQANPELFDLKSWWKNEKPIDDHILININDLSMFYEPIHSKLKKKPEKAMELVSDPNNPAKPDELDIEGDPLKENERGEINETESWSLSSKNTTNKPLNSKIKQMKLKEMRIQAVKEGLDPQSVSLNDEILLRKRLEEKEKLASKTNMNTSLWQIIENSKKLQKKTKLQHSQLAEKFYFNNFQMSSENTSKFHRFDLLTEIFDKNKVNYLKPWKIEIVPSKNSSNKNTLKRKRADITGFDEINEMVDSYEFFKSRKRISCSYDKNDSFVLFEYMEENPLILSNVGMGSKLYKYIYPQRLYNKMKKLNETNEIPKNLVAVESKRNVIKPATIEEEEKSIPPNSQVIDRENKPQKIELPSQPLENPINPEDEINKFKELIAEALGIHGSIYFLKNTEKIPLIGQLIDEKNFGMMILENNLFNVSVFKQKLAKTDFLLVRTKSEDGLYTHHLRKIDYIYIVGQIEPKLEVFSPNSRNLSSFIRKCLKFEIKQKFKTEGYVDLRELGGIFPSINDHNIRKTIRELGGEQDLGDNKLFHYNKDMIDSDNEHLLSLDEIDITPEEMCLYERMHACLSNLKEFGLTDLRNADKINLARNKFIKKNNQSNPGINPHTIRKNLIARFIAEQLHLTSWNLSQSFLTAKQTQGRLYLTGFGDPTNGHGGYSFVKKPLKTSRFIYIVNHKIMIIMLFRYEKEDKNQNDDKNEKNNLSNLNNIAGSSVTGTDADLRKLEMSKVNGLLLKYGYNPENISKLGRWEKIDLLRQISNQKLKECAGDQAMSLSIQNELGKFARSMRITTKMQKEIYQKEINRKAVNNYED